MTNSKKLFIMCHGWDASGHSLWFPWIQSLLQENGCEVIAPDFPNRKNPVYEEWKTELLKILSQNAQDKHIYFIAHSMGGYFVFRFLSDALNEPWIKNVKGIIPVGAATIKRPDYKPFYDTDIDWTVVKSIAPKIIILYSTDDDKIIPAHQELMKNNLGHLPGFEFRELEGFKHFICKEAEPIKQAVLDILK